MANQPFGKTWIRMDQMWSASSYDDAYESNISLQDMASVTGNQASLPDAATQIVPNGDYALSGSFGGLANISVNTDSYVRKMINGSLKGDICNTIFIAHDGTYKITTFEDSNTISKNGTGISTLTNRGDSTSLAALVKGDQIHGSRPFTCHHTNYPGMQGAYGGYAGFCFATRRDRSSPILYLQNLSNEIASVQVLFTSVGNSNRTSLTSVHTHELGKWDVTGGGNQFDDTYTMASSGQYFIISDKLICCWRGQGPTSDTSAMYPLSSEHLYGWYSSDGHTFAVNNAEVGRTNSGGGGTIKGVDSGGSSADIIASLSSGKQNCFGSTSANSTIRGGSYFSGDCCVVFDNDVLTGGIGKTLFAAESQADGNGSNQTFFTGKRAHGRIAMVGGACAWNAFVSSGFSGSAPPSTGYADVIMRFNSSDVFQEAKSFSGQSSTSPHSSKAYFGNGSGTGTTANAGDYFICNVAVQGYMDTDSSDKDETNCFMTNEITLPTATAHTLYADAFSSGTPGQVEPWESSTAACDDLNSGGALGGTVYSPSSTLANGSVLFWDQNYLYPVNGQNLYLGIGAGRSFSQFQLGYNGVLKTAPTAC